MLSLNRFLILFITIFGLVISGCAVEVVEVDVPTAVSSLPTSAPTTPPTQTPLATATLVPEPATATLAPSNTPTRKATQTAVPTDTPPATEEVAEETAVATSEPIVESTAEPTSEPPPPVAGGGGEVIAPPADNYPPNEDKAGWEARINVPNGFEVRYFGRVEGSPTSITFGPDSLLYIAIQEGNILTMDGSGRTNVYATGYDTPTGIAFRPGTNQLYVASRVLNQNVGGEAQISIANGRQIIGGLPCCYTLFHSANGIAFGSDGFGYVGVGARADHGEILDGPNAGEKDELHPLEASILRFDPDTGAVEVYAKGLRNAYDVAWDANGQLWASENQPDFDPPEEVHRVVPGGEHGYPWYDCDSCFAAPPDVELVPPAYTFPHSTSPTGITVYTANQFPSGYFNDKFVTLWSAFFGAQKVMRLGSGPPTNFATGFAAPIDVIIGPDGSMYVADWATGIIFRIRYSG